MKKYLALFVFLTLISFGGAKVIFAEQSWQSSEITKKEAHVEIQAEKKAAREEVKVEKKALREALKALRATAIESIKPSQEKEENPPVETPKQDSVQNNNSNNQPKETTTTTEEKEIIEIVNLTELFKTAAETGNIFWPSTYKEVRLVEFKKDLLASSKGPAILSVAGTSINFEIDGETYNISRKDLYRNLNGYSWFGKVSGARMLSHFAVVGDAVAGEIWLPDGGHHSVVSRGGKQYLVEWDDNKIGKLLKNDVIISDRSPIDNVSATNAEVTAVSSKRRAVRSSSNPLACNGDLVENIDQLIIYTPQAVDWFGSGSQAQDALEAAAQNAVDATNATIINSTREWNYRLNLIGLVEVDRSYDDGDMNRIFNLSAVKNLMDARNADSLFLMTGNYSKNPSALSGYGAGQSFVGHPAWTFVHENGHAIWKMGHNPDDGYGGKDPTMPDWAVDHYVDGVARGVMAYSNKCSKGCYVQPVFANPDVMYPDTNVPSGIRGERENWRTLEYMRNTISKFQIAGNENQCISN